MKKLYRASVGILRIRRPQSWLIQSRKFFIDDKSRCFAVSGQRQKFGANGECNLAGNSGLNGADAGNFSVRIRRIKPGSQLAREFFELHNQIGPEANLPKGAIVT